MSQILFQKLGILWLATSLKFVLSSTRCLFYDEIWFILSSMCLRSSISELQLLTKSLKGMGIVCDDTIKPRLHDQIFVNKLHMSNVFWNSSKKIWSCKRGFNPRGGMRSYPCALFAFMLLSTSLTSGRHRWWIVINKNYIGFIRSYFVQNKLWNPSLFTHSFITLGCCSPSPPITIIPFNFTFPANLKGIGNIIIY